MATQPSWASKNMTEDERWPKEARPSQFYDTIFKRMSFMKTGGSRPVGISSSQGVFSYVYFKTQGRLSCSLTEQHLGRKIKGRTRKK